jgi:multidrug resistance protein, MATE family
MTMGLIDLAFVRHVGTSATGAVGVATALFSWTMTVGMGLLAGLDFYVSSSYGAGQLPLGQKYVGQGVWLSFIVGLPLTLLLLLASFDLSLFNIHPDIIPEASSFLRILAIGLVPLFLFSALRNYLQAVNRPLPAFVVLLLSNGLNAFLDYAFIFGQFGFPTLGADGCAWATTLCRLFMLAGLILMVGIPGPTRLSLKALRWDRSVFVGLVRLGFPASLQMMLEVGVFGLSTVLAGGLDPSSLAAHQIVLNVASTTFMVTLGIGAATAVLVGQSVGKKDLAEARKMGWLGLLSSAVFMVLTGFLLLFFPHPILSGFSNDPQVLQIAASLLLIAALFQLVDGMQASLTGALRGLGNTTSPVWANWVGHWMIGLPICYVLCFKKGWGVSGIWAGLAVGLLVVAIWLTIAWVQTLKRQRV